MYRTRSHHYEYRKYLADRRKQSTHTKEYCIFCDNEEVKSHFVRQTDYFKIIRNRFPYSIWDQQRVADHLMVVPLKHTDTLTALTKEARLEYVQLVSDYEQNGYHVYARATKSDTKSISHQHTHLIKCVGRTTKLAFYLLRPYINVTW